MKIYEETENLVESTVIAYDKEGIAGKIDALNTNLNQKFKENTDKEYQSLNFAKLFVTTV